MYYVRDGYLLHYNLAENFCHALSRSGLVPYALRRNLIGQRPCSISKQVSLHWRSSNELDS